MERFNEQGLIKWEAYYEEWVKPKADRLDSYDVAILYATHKHWSKERPYVGLEVIANHVISEVGWLTDRELWKRLEKLESLALIRRAITIN